MDNRINEIRRKISVLRAEMADAEAAARDLVNREQDAAEPALRQMALRAEVTLLIGYWKAAGGGDRLPDLPERARQERRPGSIAAPRRIEKAAAAKRARAR